ncbi:hypothetical protein MRB53_025013 [Persea americana]|uniref:Uncharacterized protein n=1 Tax=Persea americana TaxID=3435 RepID=A0ACC2LEB9_PERAE|nr:hypothetical protein MRB53_025013 [Persea americana]
MPQLPALDDGQVLLKPVHALEYLQIKRGGRFRWEVLIQWDTLPLDDSTWEDMNVIRGQFPEFYLEDKASLQGEGNDANEGRVLKNAYDRARRESEKERKRERKKEWQNSIHGRSSSSASGSATGLFWWVLPPLAPSLQNSTSASQRRMLRIPNTCRGCAAR